MSNAKGQRGLSADQLSEFQRARLSWRLLRDPRVATWMKTSVPAIANAYLILPIDLIPDWFLGIGQIDDLGVLGIAILAMTRILPRIAPKELVAEHLAEMHGAKGRPRGERDVIDTTFSVSDNETVRRQRKRATGWEKSR